MSKELTLGSLFDGSGGFPLAGLLAGIIPIWASEIEPFPIRVTTKRFPNVKHLGDINGINGAEIEPVDIITFGSPCQDMSVAGKRNGLDGERSGLFYQAICIVKEMRCKTNGQYPRFVVWENVPGAFSSNKGEDFKAVLEAICRAKEEKLSLPMPKKWCNAGTIVGDGFSIAWRLLDAQYFGVPQRRRRIYLVADFAGECAGEILFERESLPGDSSPSSCEGQVIAEDAGTGTEETGTICLNDQGGNRMDVTMDKTCTLRAQSNHPPLLFENHSQDSRYVGPLDTAQTVLATFGTGGNNQPFVVQSPKTLKIRSGCDGGGKGALIQDNLSATLSCGNDQTVFVPTAFGICSKGSNSMKSANPESGVYKAETSRTLDQNGGNPACNQGGIAVVEPVKSFHVNQLQTFVVQGSMIGRKEENRPQGSGINEDVSFTLNTADHHAVAYAASKSSFFTKGQEELADTLVATDYKDPPMVGKECGEEYIVRRLTPTECARLQGFPDWWCGSLGTDNPTAEEIAEWREIFETYKKAIGAETKPKSDNQIIKWLKNPHSDSAEYKMWGNGIALPCARFVLEGIAARA